jgi:cytoskeletal protein CcmA (bactofilin family)
VFRVTATINNYNGVNSQAVAYLTKSAGVNQALPSNYLMYVGNSGSSSIILDSIGNFASAHDVTIAGGTNSGTFAIKGNLTLSNTNGSFQYGSSSGYANKIAIAATGNVDDEGNQIYGDIISGGNVTIDLGAGQVYGNIYAAGDVTVAGGATVNGNIYSNGNLMNISNSTSTINGNVYIGGNIGSTGTPFVDHVNGSALCQHNAYIGWTPSFYSLTLGGIWSLPGNTISSFVSGQASQNQIVAPVSVNTFSFTPSTMNTVAIPSQASNAALYNPVTITNNTISSDGSLDNFSPSSYSGSSITIDATSHDINLLVNNTITFNYNCQGFKTIGTHNVYIWLNTNASLSLTGCYIGPADTSAQPNVFIIGSNQSVTVSNASIYGYVYIPNGSFSTTSSNQPYSPSGMSVSKVLYGSVICNSSSIAWNVPMQYISPNLSGTPLANAIAGGSMTINGTDLFYGSSAGSSTWSFSGWSSQ